MCKEAKSTYAFLYDFGWKGNDEDAKFTHPDFPGHVIRTLQGGRWNSGARWRHEVNGKVVEKADEARPGEGADHEGIRQQEDQTVPA